MQEPLPGHVDLVHRDVALGAFQRPEHLANAIDPDGKHQEFDPPLELHHVKENQARLAGDDVEPDGGKHKADEDRVDRLRDVVAAEANEGREGEHHEGEFLLRPELQGEGRERRREEREKDNRDRAADEGGDGRRGQGLIGLAGLGHGSPVKDGGHGG